MGRKCRRELAAVLAETGVKDPIVEMFCSVKICVEGLLLGSPQIRLVILEAVDRTLEVERVERGVMMPDTAEIDDDCVCERGRVILVSNFQARRSWSTFQKGEGLGLNVSAISSVEDVREGVVAGLSLRYVSCGSWSSTSTKAFDLLRLDGDEEVADSSDLLGEGD